MSHRCRVLIVDDDEDIREAVCAALEVLGHDFVAVADGALALEYLATAAELPELVLLDLMMPVMDGAAFRAAQLASPRLAGIPVIVMSAHASIADQAVALRAVAYRRKPVELCSLAGLIADHCGTDVART